MALYVDTEFNGFGGEFISIGIANTNGDNFYMAIEPNAPIHPWVREHVMPNLGSRAGYSSVRHYLQEYITKYAWDDIYADWPEDLIHLLKFLYEYDGKALNINLKLHLIQSGALTPETPHHALSDAIALMNWHQQGKK